MSDEVVIVGKTNVGKSLLFNKLIGQKKSLVINLFVWSEPNEPGWGEFEILPF